MVCLQFSLQHHLSICIDVLCSASCHHDIWTHSNVHVGACLHNTLMQIQCQQRHKQGKRSCTSPLKCITICIWSMCHMWLPLCKITSFKEAQAQFPLIYQNNLENRGANMVFLGDKANQTLLRKDWDICALTGQTPSVSCFSSRWPSFSCGLIR